MATSSWRCLGLVGELVVGSAQAVAQERAEQVPGAQSSTAASTRYVLTKADEP
jgi:hypothetical protein